MFTSETRPSIIVIECNKNSKTGIVSKQGTNFWSNLPKKNASKRRYAMRTSSVGLTMPVSFIRFLISVIVYTVELKTTSMVTATVFVTKGPLPCFERSRPFTTNFRIGFAKDNTKVNAIWVIKSMNKGCIIFV